MKNHKSVKEVIRKGAWEVNGIVTLIMIASLVLSLALGFLFPKEYELFAFLLGIVLVIGLPWLWWSYKIAEWRIWAFENTRKEDWEKLTIEAVKAKLIWERGSIFEKTEIRTQSQQTKINVFYTEMDQMKMEEISKEYTIDDVEDDSSIPTQREYHYDSGDILAELIYFVIMIGLGIYFLYENNIILSIILFAVTWFATNFKMLKNISNKDTQLIINEKGIDMKFEELGFVEWKDAENIVVDTENGHLTLGAWKGEEYFEVNFSLQYLTVKDYEKFLTMINVYKKRYFVVQE